MATLAGFVQQAWNTTGTATLTYPAGTLAGHMAIVEASHSNSPSPLPSGWTPAGGSIHWRMLTAADIAAGSVTVKASLTSLTVLSGAAGIGRTGDDDDVKVRSATGGLFVRGWTSRWRSSLAPADYRIGAETTSSEDNHKHAVFFRAVTAAGYYDIPGTSDDAEFRAFEILGPTPPTAPTLTGPETGANVDRELPVLLSFVHQSAAGLPMQRCRVLVRPLGGTWVALKSDGTLDTVATTERVQSAGEAAIAAGVLTAGTVYEWQVYTMDAGGWSPASAAERAGRGAVPQSGHVLDRWLVSARAISSAARSAACSSPCSPAISPAMLGYWCGTQAGSRPSARRCRSSSVRELRSRARRRSASARALASATAPIARWAVAVVGTRSRRQRT